MTKSELKNGMIVELRNGYQYIVIDDRMVNNEGWTDLNDYDDNLADRDYCDSEWDIVIVYAYINEENITSTNIKKLIASNYCECIYNRYNEDYKNKEINEIENRIKELKDELKEISQKLKELEDLLNEH